MNLTVGDPVLDKTAISNGWDDKEGVVVEVDTTYPSRLKVRYISGNERPKWITNLRRKPGTGRWYLTYISFDGMENSTSMAEYEQRFGLNGKTEVEAIIEARALWKKACERKHTGWNKETYPQNPRVFYEVVWPEEERPT